MKTHPHPSLPQSPCLRPSPQGPPEALPSPLPRRVARPHATVLRAAAAGVVAPKDRLHCLSAHDLSGNEPAGRVHPYHRSIDDALTLHAPVLSALSMELITKEDS